VDQTSLEAVLSDLNLPAIRYFETIDSTNNEANRWIDRGAYHLSLVVANEQTAGRGRSGRRWVTSPGTGLAFSLILHSPPLGSGLIPRLTGLGAIAVQHTLHEIFNLTAEIKWPNDVLLNGRKVAGVLVDARWEGESLCSAIIGIGINIASGFVSKANHSTVELDFPATCVELETDHPVNRLEVLHAILREFISWLPRLSLPEFISTWESALAFHNQWVELSNGDALSIPKDERTPASPQVGKMVGLTQDGSLKLLTSSGMLVIEPVGDIHLRPV